MRQKSILFGLQSVFSLSEIDIGLLRAVAASVPFLPFIIFIMATQINHFFPFRIGTQILWPKFISLQFFLPNPSVCPNLFLLSLFTTLTPFPYSSNTYGDARDKDIIMGWFFDEINV